MKTTISQLRILGLLEGLSFLLLLGICVPLKYFYDMPEPTKIVGMAHGVLFIAYCVWVVISGKEYRWDLKTITLSLIAGVVPFGTFVADKRFFKEIDY